MISAASVLMISVLLIADEVSWFKNMYTFIIKMDIMKKLPSAIPFRFHKDDLYFIGINTKLFSEALPTGKFWCKV